MGPPNQHRELWEYPLAKKDFVYEGPNKQLFFLPRFLFSSLYCLSFGCINFQGSVMILKVCPVSSQSCAGAKFGLSNRLRENFAAKKVD